MIPHRAGRWSRVWRARELVLVSLLVAGCREPTPPVLGPGSWSVLFSVPVGDEILRLTIADDSTLFVVSFAGTVWRGLPPDYVTWEAVIEGGSAQSPGSLGPLWAPSRNLFFATQGSRVFRWEQGSGVREEVIPLSHDSKGCYDFFTGVHLTDIWGRSAEEVYAVGDHGEIIRYDGETWQLDSTEMTASAPDICYQAFPHALWAVGGNAKSVVTAGGNVFQRSSADAWTHLPNPPGADTTGLITAVAVLDDGVWLADPAHVYHRVGDAWRTYPLEIWREWKSGSRQPDGSALFWDYNKYVILIRDGKVMVRYLNGLRAIRGVVAVGNTVFAGSHQGDTAVIVRATVR